MSDELADLLGDDDLVPPTDEDADVDDDTQDDEQDAKSSDEEPAKEPEEEQPDVDQLMDEIETLRKERHGLYKSAKDERRKRQEMSGRLEQLTTTVNDILTQRQAQENVAGSDAPSDQLLPLELTDEGDALVDVGKIQQRIQEPLVQKLNNLEQQLAMLTQGTAQQQKEQEVLDRLLSEKPGYREAYSDYAKARRWVNDKVIEWQDMNDIQGEITSGQALDYIVDKSMMNEFEKQFPNMDITQVIQAEDSQFEFRRMLDSLASTDTEEKPGKDSDEDDRFQKVLKKPSGLAGGTNSKAEEMDVMERLGTLSTDDIMNMSDEKYEQLQRALAAEEKKGIKFR